MKNIRNKSARAIKKDVSVFLEENTDHRKWINNYTTESVIGPLISFFYHKDPLIKFRAIKILGTVVSELYDERPEKARVIMRRFMWNLNDESGGIGWGSPETMGEAMARNKGLAKEFGKMLISYINVDGNYLEHPELQKGALWGIMRCGKNNQEIFKDALNFLPVNFNSKNPETRGLSLLASVNLGIDEKKLDKSFKNDTNSFKVFIDDKFVEYKICELLNPLHQT